MSLYFNTYRWGNFENKRKLYLKAKKQGKSWIKSSQNKAKSSVEIRKTIIDRGKLGTRHISDKIGKGFKKSSKFKEHKHPTNYTWS